MNLPRGAHVVEDLTGVGIAHQVAVRESCIQIRGAISHNRDTPIDVIEEIEKFGAKLQADVLFNLCVLGNRDVGVVEAGAAQAEASGVAEGAERRGCKRVGSKYTPPGIPVTGLPLPTKLGRGLTTPVPKPSVSTPWKTVNGRPVVEETMPLICQPETTRFFLKGRAHNPFTRSDCVMS